MQYSRSSTNAVMSLAAWFQYWILSVRVQCVVSMFEGAWWLLQCAHHGKLRFSRDSFVKGHALKWLYFKTQSFRRESASRRSEMRWFSGGALEGAGVGVHSQVGVTGWWALDLPILDHRLLMSDLTLQSWELQTAGLLKADVRQGWTICCGCTKLFAAWWPL
jgi:hypothetical protein